MSDNDDIRAALHGLTADEPPMEFGVAEVIASGRRRQVRRTGMVAGVASVAAVVAVTVPLTMFGGNNRTGGAGSGSPVRVPPTPRPAASCTATPSTPPALVPATPRPTRAPSPPQESPTRAPSVVPQPPAPVRLCDGS